MHLKVFTGIITKVGWLSFVAVRDFGPYMLIFMNLCVVITVALMIIWCYRTLGFMG
jgi:hypothetical protein